MKGISLEFKVGFFVVAAILVLSILVFQIGGINIFKTNRYTLNVIFDFVNGIAKDAPVHVAGVSVGEVKNVEIFYDNTLLKTQVRLVLSINDTVKIPNDSVAYINTLGILGEKYVEVVPGLDRKNFLANNDFIIGNNPVQLEKLTESLVDVVGDQTVRDSLRESFYNMRIATENLRQTTEMLNETMTELKNGKGTIGRLLKDDSIYVKTEIMITDLNQNLNKTVIDVNEKLNKTITDLNTSLNELVGDFRSHPWKLFRKPAAEVKTNKPIKKDKKADMGKGEN